MAHRPRDHFGGCRVSPTGCYITIFLVWEVYKIDEMSCKKKLVMTFRSVASQKLYATNIWYLNMLCQHVSRHVEAAKHPGYTVLFAPGLVCVGICSLTCTPFLPFLPVWCQFLWRSCNRYFLCVLIIVVTCFSPHIYPFPRCRHSLAFIAHVP